MTSPMSYYIHGTSGLPIVTPKQGALLLSSDWLEAFPRAPTLSLFMLLARFQYPNPKPWLENVIQKAGTGTTELLYTIRSSSSKRSIVLHTGTKTLPSFKRLGETAPALLIKQRRSLQSFWGQITALRTGFHRDKGIRRLSICHYSNDKMATEQSILRLHCFAQANSSQPEHSTMQNVDRVDAYQQKIAAVQETLGLQTDSITFSRIKVAVDKAAHRLLLRNAPTLKGHQTLEEKGGTCKVLALKIKRAAWWVRERVPISQNHRSLVGAVQSLLEIRWTEVQRREDIYRKHNGSEATLPDFNLLLDSEELQAPVKGLAGLRGRIIHTAEDYSTFICPLSGQLFDKDSSNSLPQIPSQARLSRQRSPDHCGYLLHCLTVWKSKEKGRMGSMHPQLRPLRDSAVASGRASHEWKGSPPHSSLARAAKETFAFACTSQQGRSSFHCEDVMPNQGRSVRELQLKSSIGTRRGFCAGWGQREVLKTQWENLPTTTTTTTGYAKRLPPPLLPSIGRRTLKENLKGVLEGRIYQEEVEEGKKESKNDQNPDFEAATKWDKFANVSSKPIRRGHQDQGHYQQEAFKPRTERIFVNASWMERTTGLEGLIALNTALGRVEGGKRCGTTIPLLATALKHLYALWFCSRSLDQMEVAKGQALSNSSSLVHLGLPLHLLLSTSATLRRSQLQQRLLRWQTQMLESQTMLAYPYDAMTCIGVNVGKWYRLCSFLGCDDYSSFCNPMPQHHFASWIDRGLIAALRLLFQGLWIQSYDLT
ncbi:hypothetical protein BKA70DRAFT_1219740 [Coprinopsis sp. MPI-PUGE-AT-0042]|nr:hypothetical protein BKA70DRAFT_1219740 [Coprinopsis sp. MPI-PUGE-AT-0042]